MMHELFDHLTLDDENDDAPSIVGNPFNRLDYKHTLYREIDATSYKACPLTCFICRKSFGTATLHGAHLLTEHSLINDDELNDRNLGWLKSHEAKLRCSFVPGKPDDVKQIQITNIHALPLELCQIYVVIRKSDYANNIKADRKKLYYDGEHFCLLETLFCHGGTILVIVQAIGQTGLELIEYHLLRACCNPLPMKMMEIPKYGQCADLKELVTKNQKTKRPQSIVRMNVQNYSEVLAKLNMLDRLANQMELDEYTTTNVEVKTTDEKFVTVCIRGVKDQMTKLSVGCEVIFTLMTLPHETITAVRTATGDIEEIHKNHLKIQLRENDPNVDANRRYTLMFMLCSYTYDIETHSLHVFCENKAVKCVFPQTARWDVSFVHRPFRWFTPDIASNKRQVQAVNHIVAGTAFPSPYLLFGPPGTGKTKTLVEAIAQIYTTDTTSRILVCATSNAAADEITLRLLKILPNQCWSKHNVYRIYSSSFRPDVPLDDDLRHSSNFDLKFCPDWQHLEKFRIIIATMIVGGALRYGANPQFRFTHLFIDECGSATEIASLVPMALCINARIVLAGDPRQLGPVVTQPAMDMGYGISMLERLMHSVSVYQKNKFGRYNPNVLTQLVNNYRSHPAIIAPSNRLFYDGDLRARGRSTKTHCFIDWKELPNRNVPIIFHASTTPSDVDNKSKSVYNMAEVDIIIDYFCSVMKESMNGETVKESDIGIISPYRKQCAQIKEALQKLEYHNVMVATVESFQGKEKPIILISTARSGRKGIGFLANPKRLNVMLTRAQCLMVIVGDPNTLRLDKWWRMVLEEFNAIHAWKGQPFHKQRPRQRSRLTKIIDGKTLPPYLLNTDSEKATQQPIKNQTIHRKEQ